MPIPCIAICVNAGKCVSRIFKALSSRGYSNIPILILGSHVCAAILLMNFWDLKWQERNHMNCDGFEDIKSPLALPMAELLEEVAVFVEALEAIKPRWRSAEMYLSAFITTFLVEISAEKYENRNDLTSSLPHSLGGYEPSICKDDPLLRHYPPKFDDHIYLNTAPQEYTGLGDYRDPPPEYPIALPPPINTYTYDSQVEPSQCGPHFFEFPHITRYPVPSTLPLLPPSVSCGRDQSMSTSATMFQSQRDYDRLSMHTELDDKRSSTSSIHSRPASLFDKRAVDDTHTAQKDASTRQPYTMASRASYGGSVSVPTHPSAVGNFGPYQPMYVFQYAFWHATDTIS